MLCLLGMVYLHKAPAPQLARFIECFWYADTAGSSLFNDLELYFPDPRAELYFNLGKPYSVKGEGSLSCPVHLWGPRSAAQSLTELHETKLLVVRFTPLGHSYFFGPAANEISGTWAGFDCIDEEAYARLWDDVQEKSFYSACGILEGYFTSKLKDESFEDRRAEALYNTLLSTPAQKLTSALDKLGYTYRTAQRHFHARFGMSPKQLQQLMKLNTALNLMKSGYCDSEELALLSGYYDSSDMAGRFRQSIGRTPGEIAKSPGLIFQALHPKLRTL